MLKHFGEIRGQRDASITAGISWVFGTVEHEHSVKLH